MSDQLSMKQENLEMEELEENSMHHIVIKQEPQVYENVSEIRDPDLDIENFKEEITSYPENQIDKSEQFSNGTDNDNLADIEEDKPLKRKKLKKKSMKSEQFSNGTDQGNLSIGIVNWSDRVILSNTFSLFEFEIRVTVYKK